MPRLEAYASTRRGETGTASARRAPGLRWSRNRNYSGFVTISAVRHDDYPVRRWLGAIEDAAQRDECSLDVAVSFVLAAQLDRERRQVGERPIQSVRGQR